MSFAEACVKRACALVSLRIGDADGAKRHLAAAARVFQRQGRSIMGTVSAMALHGAVLADLGDMPMARRLLLKCVVLAKCCGMRGVQATLHNALVQVCESADSGFKKEAEKHRSMQR